MENLSDINVIKSILTRHGFTFSKSLGQNFLINPSVCPRMADMSGAEKGVGILEIGPGIGVLTAELAKKAEKVVSIELDQRLLPVLAETLSDYHNVEIIHADILKLNLLTLLNEKFSNLKVCVCANLPYYITSPIIMYLLESHLPLEAITVMVQKEAAQRLCANVGSRESGAITAAVNYYADAKILFQVSRGSFMPSPNVDSSVIQFTIKKEPPVHVENEKLFFSLIHCAFEQRRKTALNALSAGSGFSKDVLQKSFQQANIPLTIRGEKLKLEDFALLTNILSK